MCKIYYAQMYVLINILVNVANSNLDDYHPLFTHFNITFALLSVTRHFHEHIIIIAFIIID